MTGFPHFEAVSGQHTAFLGKTGSGKTSTAKLAIEQAVETGARVCILDPIKSDWWGITSSADGQSAGLPFRILGGPRGHVALPSSAGAVVGKLVATGALPLSIIDMADFEPGGLQRFFVDFAPALLRHMRGVLYLVIEEAHEFAPKERAGFSGENMTVHFAKKLATAGRSKGIRLIVATQRVQALHNAVLGSCETMVAHRLTAPADQKPVTDWLAANASKEIAKEVAASLASLPTGTGWLCSGEAQLFERIAFPKFSTFDNAATPTADSEEVAVKTAAVDHDELAALIGDAVAEAEANDPKKLKAEVARLTKELAGAQAGTAATEPTWPDQRTEVVQLRGALIVAEKRLQTAHNAIDAIAGLAAGIDTAPVRGPGVQPTPQPRPAAAPAPVQRQPATAREDTAPHSGLNAAAEGIAGLLKGLPGHHAAWSSLLVLGGFRPGSGWIRKSEKQLVEEGYIRRVGDVTEATEKLIESDILPLTMPTPAELRALWKAKLRGPGGAMAAWLAQNGPATRQEIAEGIGMSATAGWTRKGFKDLIGSNLADEAGDGKLAAHPLLVDK